jgi:methylated-DNA-[protein]-cysteine S-methyltransferase
VIGSNGKMVGYAGGLDIKERLLGMEKQHANGRTQ